MFGFYLLFLIQYVAEILVIFDVAWTSLGDDGLPILRKAMKSVYLSIRVMTYCLFLFR